MKLTGLIHPNIVNILMILLPKLHFYSLLYCSSQVRLLHFFEEPNSFYVVLEYLDGGDLFDRIIQKTYYNEKEARDCALCVLRGIKICHDNHVIHR